MAERNIFAERPRQPPIEDAAQDGKVFSFASPAQHGSDVLALQRQARAAGR